MTEGSYGINFVKDDCVGGSAEEGLRYALDPGASALVVMVYSERHVNLRVRAQTEQPVLTEPAGAAEGTSGFMSPRSCNDQS